MVSEEGDGGSLYREASLRDSGAVSWSLDQAQGRPSLAFILGALSMKMGQNTSRSPNESRQDSRSSGSTGNVRRGLATSPSPWPSTG